MPTLNEFSSLLQLGAGLGIGLSVFRAPYDIRANNLGNVVLQQRVILTGIQSSKALEKLKALGSIELLFIEQRAALERLQKPALIATVIVAFVNLAFLVWAALDAQHILTPYERTVLLFFSVVYYFLAVAYLEVTARLKFGQVTSRLTSLVQS